MGVLPDCRQRNLFPLPFLNEHDFDKAADVCRPTAQRALHKAKAREWANDGILALNQLAGQGSKPSKDVIHFSASSLYVLASYTACLITLNKQALTPR